MTDKLELDAALRVDKYPNFSANIAPKIGFKYQAFDQLMLRGTYSTGFRAPTLPEAFYSGINVSVSSLSGVFAWLAAVDLRG